MFNHLTILDNETKEHSLHVYDLVCNFSTYLNLTKEECEILAKGALLHDIGKAFIDQNILLSSKKLTEKEFEIIKEHPIKGFHYSKSFCDPIVSRIILEHHERIDGNGYPYKKKGDEIHYFSRIVSICDSFSVIISKRSYKEEHDEIYAIEELRKNAGTQFDKDLVGLFVNYIEEYSLSNITKNTPTSLGGR